LRSVIDMTKEKTKGSNVMSQGEVERFSNDLKSKPDLLAKVKPHATGLASVVSLAAQNGYHFSLEDAKQFIKAKSPQPLNDEQLDAIAGGQTSTNFIPPPVTVTALAVAVVVVV
jgi:predicted ribosomally synthesized peptide with nif11-like leader